MTTIAEQARRDRVTYARYVLNELALMADPDYVPGPAPRHLSVRDTPPERTSTVEPL